MRGLLAYATAAVLVAPALAGPVHLDARSGNNKDRCNHDNPFKDVAFYANKGYAAKVDETVKAFLDRGETRWAAGARAVQKISTFIWLSAISDIATLEAHLIDAEAVAKETGKKQLVPLVVYNLPDRDCSAASSAGELIIAEDGFNKYKTLFVNPIVEILKRHPTLQYAIVLEPDSLANSVTNAGPEGPVKCQVASPIYKAGIAYAISKMQDKNMALYIDAGHSNWLGWTGNLETTAQVMADVLKLAGQRSRRIRGFATNVSNYNAYNSTTPDKIYGPGPDNAQWNEWRYVTALTPYLAAKGVPTKFIVDQGRSGKQDIRAGGGNWCNINNAGFGIKPTTNTKDCNVDALVWIKPGGESDGSSDANAPRFDENCVSENAFVPSPQAGTWHEAYIEMLIKNAWPPL